MSENDESLSERLRRIRKRALYRDQYYLRLARKNAMRSLAEDFAEWILQETKDLLETLEIIESLKNPGINMELQPYEKRVKQIQKKYMRKVIAPMRKIGRGTSGAKNEEEHCMKFQVTMGNAFCLIRELAKMRENLKMITVTIEYIANARARANSNSASSQYTA